MPRRLLLVEPDGRATLCDPDSGVRSTLDAPDTAEAEAGGGRSVVRTAASAKRVAASRCGGPSERSSRSTE